MSGDYGMKDKKWDREREQDIKKTLRYIFEYLGVDLKYAEYAQAPGEIQDKLLKEYEESLEEE